MGSFASKTETPQEQMKSYKREVDRAVRDLDRERRKMETQNDRLTNDIKKAAKANQPSVVKIMAKDYVRGKRQIQKFYQLRTHLQGVGLQLQTMKSVDAMATAMKNTTRAMIRMNQRLNIPQLTSIMRDFGLETSKMEDTTEMMGDTLDDVFAVDGAEEEEDDIVKQVMEELNLEMAGSIASAPSAAMGIAKPVAAAPAKVATATDVGAGSGSGTASAAAPPPPSGKGGPPGDGGDGGGGAAASAGAGGSSASSDLAARLASLRAGGSGSGGAAGGAGAP